jgi:hypothetical protein
MGTADSIQDVTINLRAEIMGLLRTGIAGLGAWKWGGGIIGTIVVFVVLYWLLGAMGMS